MKFKLTTECREFIGIKLFRIEALIDIPRLGVKAGDMSYDTANVRKALKNMADEGCEAFVLGCTEVPVAVEMYHLEGNFIDATEVLAEKAVEKAGAKVISHLPHKAVMA